MCLPGTSEALRVALRISSCKSRVTMRNELEVESKTHSIEGCCSQSPRLPNLRLQKRPLVQRRFCNRNLGSHDSAVPPPPPDAAFPFQNQTHAKPLHRVSRAHRCAFRVFEKGAKAHNMGIYQVRGISMCETLNRTGYETLTGPDMRLWPDRAVGRRARKFARVAKRQ